MSHDYTHDEVAKIQKVLDYAFRKIMRDMAKDLVKPKNRKHRRHGGKAR